MLNKLKGGEISKIYWYIRNLISYSSADKAPKNNYMPNYDEYWIKVLDEELGGGSYPFIINILDKRVKSNSRLLDIGCGNGEILRIFSNKMNYVHVDIIM